MQTLTSEIRGRYLQSMAYSIVLLAYRKKRLKEFLMGYLSKQDLLQPNEHDKYYDPCIPAERKLLMPINYAISQRKVEWLINETKHVDQDVKVDILRILNLVGRKGISMPKAAPAWGVVFNETLGPTLGDPDKPSKLDYSQVIILKSACKHLEKFELTKWVNSASLGALNRCFETANSDFQRLEPEVVSWLSGSRKLEMYFSDNNQQFENILQKVYESNLIFFLFNSQVSTSILALQPSISEGYYELVSDLGPVD